MNENMDIINKNKLQGIGGWLGFYTWSNLIVQPLFIFMMLNYSEYIKQVSPQVLAYFPNIPFYERMVLAAIAFLENLACLMLVAQRPKAIMFVKHALSAQIGFIIAKFIISGDYLRGTETLLSRLNITFNALCIPLLWYIYFKKSKRVQNTFPESVNQWGRV